MAESIANPYLIAAAKRVSNPLSKQRSYAFNAPIEKFNKAYLTPQYSPSELLALSTKGYVGAFTKGSKTLLGTMGPAYSTMNALRDLRAGRFVKPYTDYTPYNEYGTHGINIGGNELDAAKAPTREQLVDYADKATYFAKRYGADGSKYLKMYGKLPSEDSKFADLFSVNNNVVKAAALDSFRDENYKSVMKNYQNTLADQLLSIGRNLVSESKKNPTLAALEAEGILAITTASKYRPSDGKYSSDNIEALKKALKMDPTDGVSTEDRWSQDIQKAIGASNPTFDPKVLNAAFGVGPLGFVNAAIANSEVGQKALTNMQNAVSSPTSILAPEDVNESNPFDLIGGLFANSVRSLGRMAAGFPLGVYIATDEAFKASQALKDYATGETKSFGENVDFQLGDAIWADFAQRYYDPFAVDKNGNGRNFWKGLQDGDSYKRFANKMSQDPVAPVLDLLSVVPAVGWAVKGTALSATIGKFGRAGQIGAEADAILQAQKLVNGANKVGGVWAERGAGVLEAQEKIDMFNAARATISPRRYRSLMRQAITGDALATKALDDYRRFGLIIPSVKDQPFIMKAAAKFEARTRVLDNARAVGNLEDGSVVALERLPASPLARGTMELATFLRRSVYNKLEDATAIDGPLDSARGRRVADVLVDLPLVGYRWQYSRALGNNMRYFWGDLATDVHRSQEMLKLREESTITTPMERAVMSELNGGDGSSAFGKFNDPAYQRTTLELRRAEVEKRIRNKELNADDPSIQQELDTIDARISALPDASDYEKAVRDLQEKIDNPERTSTPEVEAAYRLRNEMKYQRERIKSLVNDETTPVSLEYYKMVFAEAMQALKIRPDQLFGKGGELNGFLKRVIEVDDNFPLNAGFFNSDEAWRMVVDEDGNNVFDKITNPKERKKRIDQFNEVVKKLYDDDGLFRDASGSAEVRGAPILILAKGAKLNSKFVPVHRVRLTGEISDTGIVSRNRLVDTSETLYVPREMLVPKRVGYKEAEKLLEDGSLNAMAEYFPNANFYSDKVSEAGLRGEKSNFADVKNDHIVATLGLKEHTMRMQILSQIHYLRNRIERDLEEVANANAELIPMDQVLGSNALVLKSVRVFDSLDKAEQFARLRGLEPAFRGGVKQYNANKASTLLNSPFDVESGFGTIQRDGKTLFVVRGDIRDWSTYALRDTSEGLSNPDMYKRVLYEDLRDITSDQAQGVYAMVVPRKVDNVLKQTVIEGNDYASRLLKNPLANAPTNIFKRLVLAFNPRFISTNVVGGTAMYMMHNPNNAPKTFARAVAYGARKAGIKEWEDIAEESNILGHHLAYEFDNNIYRLDSGIKSIEDATRMGRAKKYGWNGGYTVVRSFEEFLRKAVAKDFLMDDAGFRAFMDGPEVQRYIDEGIDFRGNRRTNISKFEAATDMLLDPRSKFYQHDLKMRMRYTTNTISGNYHSFSPTEQFVRNFLMPFYSWQRHSLAFTWRLPIDKPITAAVIGNLGQYGYTQALETGLPSWMYQTVPMPDFIENLFGITDEDRRIGLDTISPFGTAADMSMAATRLLTGKDMGSNIFEFTNPLINATIKQTLDVDPVTGTRIRPEDRKGITGTLWDSVQNMPGVSIPKSLVFEAINGQYERNALSNKYKTIDNATDVFRNYDDGEKDTDWRLYVPEERGTLQAGTYKDQLFNVFFPLKPYSINADRMQGQAKEEAVAYGIMNAVQKNKDATRVESYISGVDEWRRKRDYIMQVWLPVAEKQLSPEQIAFVINKLDAEKPEDIAGVSFDNTVNLLGG
jgi:hypothetical protein